MITKVLKYYILKDLKLLLVLLGFLCKLFPVSLIFRYLAFITTFVQISGKHVQEFGLQIRYMADGEVALTNRMLAAFAFVPPNDVFDSFDTFADYSRDVYGQDLEDMLDYFEDNYISRFRHNAPRKRPTFNIETWNMFHSTDNELPRTNNTLEGSHRGFQSHVKTCHPSFWKFIDIMKQEKGLV